MDNTPDNISCSIATAIQILNIKHLPDFAKWKIQQNFKKINTENIVGGIEAGNLHLICGPSNNAKSIFMINLLYKMAEMNKHEFDGNDIIIYITLEDKQITVLIKFREFGETLTR